MKKTGTTSRQLRFLMYVAVVVLINLAGITLFLRLDLTAKKMYSLSDASRQAVASLSEPLTVKVFFTENLPAPYNNIERYLRDLLQEYALAANRYFNYQFFNVSADEKEEKGRNRDLASDYGIHPVQIQNFDRDEVKFQNAYMGLVMIHGDLIEKIPAITSTDGLEYDITGKIRKMNDKISALLNLKENVKVRLFLSSSLQAVAPYLNLPGLAELPGQIEGVVKKLNDKNYGRLTFENLDPSQNPELDKELEAHHILTMRWDEFTDRRGQIIQADKGAAGLVVGYGSKVAEIPLISAIRLPIFGTQYQLADLEKLETSIDESVENVIDINEQIGYLSSHGCQDLGGGFSMPGQRREGGLTNLNKLLGESYSIKRIDLKKEGIPEGIASLVIAGPKESFTDYELFQLDQYLMKGRSLVLFLDAFQESMPPDEQGMMFQQQGPTYVPVRTGLEKLLSHYGISEKPAYVLDENCFKQRLPQGGGERPIYVAPIIKKEWINASSSIMQNIKGLIMLKASPVEVDPKRVEENGLEAVRLFSSTDRSWEMKDRITPAMFMMPPPEDKDRRSVALAYVLEGALPSYFADKPIPERPVPAAEEKTAPGKEAEVQPEAGVDMSKVTSDGVTVKKGKPARIFLVGTSDILGDNVLDEGGKSPNAQFVLNAIDVLNGREAQAVMRTKTQMFNPMDEIKPGTRTAIKTFNVAGLPLLVIMAGMVVWFRRARRKRRIQELFRK